MPVEEHKTYTTSDGSGFDSKEEARVHERIDVLYVFVKDANAKTIKSALMTISENFEGILRELRDKNALPDSVTVKKAGRINMLKPKKTKIEAPKKYYGFIRLDKGVWKKVYVSGYKEDVEEEYQEELEYDKSNKESLKIVELDNKEQIEEKLAELNKEFLEKPWWAVFSGNKEITGAHVREEAIELATKHVASKFGLPEDIDYFVEFEEVCWGNLNGYKVPTIFKVKNFDVYVAQQRHSKA